MTLSAAQLDLRKQLEGLYEPREAANIAEAVMGHLTGMDRSSRLIQKHRVLDENQVDRLAQYAQELLDGRPLQYVLGEAWFAGMAFFVDEQVLIPRPETEELVEWAVERARASGIPAPAILDMGTGSGCIAVSLKKKLPHASVLAIDKSAGALSVATRNAAANAAELGFRQLDFLDPLQRDTLPSFDLIVSNPPYIPHRDKEQMAAHVLDHEPHLALFVENDDPLLFYRALAVFGKRHLHPGGSLLCEIHEDMGQQTVDLFSSLGYMHVELRKDMQGKDRMVIGYRL
jgi:release factor glutamine methyltransferase